MIPGTVDPGVAASPPGGDLYFASAASIASPGVPLSGNLRVAPLMFESPTNAGGQSVALASQAAGGGHVSEVLNFRGSPVPWIGIALLMLFGLLVLTAEFRLKGPGHSKVGGEVVL
jgi:hypothetical protein